MNYHKTNDEKLTRSPPEYLSLRFAALSNFPIIAFNNVTLTLYAFSPRGKLFHLLHLLDALPELPDHLRMTSMLGIGAVDDGLQLK
jgi:hypothetical protein